MTRFQQIGWPPNLLKLSMAVMTACLMTAMTGCVTTASQTPQKTIIVAPNQQKLTGSFAYVLQQGMGKNRVSRLVTSRLDGSDAKVLTVVKGTISNLSASGDGQTLVFTQQENGFPVIFTYNLTTHEKTLITPQRANHFSANISPDNKKVLLSSSMNQNPEIYLTEIDGTNPQQLTHNKSVDIAPFWSPNQKWFAYTSDRSGLYHPQLYRYDFDTQKTIRIATTGGYNANAKISPNGNYISYITKLPRDNIRRVLRNLDTGKTWTFSDDELTESMSFSPDGAFGVYSKKYAIELSLLPDDKSESQLRPFYRLGLAQIDLPASVLSYSMIREPIWLK